MVATLTPEHPPPSYLDHDIDAISLRSAAPSYSPMLPPPYEPRTYSSLIRPTSTPNPIPTHHAFNVASWPSLSNQSQSRACLNVAARRAKRQQEDERDADIVRHALQSNGGAGGSGSSSSSSSSSSSIAFEEALRAESKSWDFFTAQINDWDQREASWRAFRAKHESSHGTANKKGKSRGMKWWGLYGRLG